MKPLLVLLVSFVASLFVIQLIKKEYNFALSARIAMAVMLVFTAVGHFAFTRGMAMMLPEFVPYKTELVYLTGGIEIIAAIGLFVPTLRVLTAWLLILFFILILPVNIYAALKNVNYQTGTLDGNGPMYLWFRIPLQLLFIIWIYLSAIRGL